MKLTHLHKVISRNGRLFMTHTERTKDNYRSKVLHEVVVTDIVNLSDTVKGYELRVASDTGFNFLPGQWLDVLVPYDETIVGGYSITSSPNQFVQSGKFGLAIQYSDHPPTHWMHKKCTVGTQIRVRVGGDFFYDPAPTSLSDLFLVAGGIGINPIYSILRHQCDLLRTKVPTRIPANVFMYSARNYSELIFKSEIEETVSSENHKAFDCHFYSTRESSSENQINGHRIKEVEIKEAVEQLDPAHLQCYICGPPPLINFVTETLLKNGVKDSSIHYEKWW